MVIAVGGAAVCLLFLCAFGKRNPTAAKMAKAALAFCALGVIAAANERLNPLLKDGGVLVRNENGEGGYEVDLAWRLGESVGEGDVTVQMEERELSDREAAEALEAARAEVDETFLGENVSLEEIRTNVCLKSEYQNGLVAAEWSFGSYEWVDLEGNIFSEDAPEEGAAVKASVELSCGERTQEYEFFFLVCPKTYSDTELLEKELEDALAESVADARQKEVRLPQTVDGQTVSWEQKGEHLPEKLVFFGAVAAACMPLAEKSRRQEREKERKRLLQTEYPKLVGKLSILLGSGMTLYAAWNRIASGYEAKRKARRGKEHPLYEEMLIACREMESGAGEARAIEKFGERCGLHLYRKFCGLLTQNLKKGTRGLTELLEQEAAAAFEERKNLAKKYGEEAGTKMLLPMMMMFGIVVAVIMIPALLSMQ